MYKTVKANERENIILKKKYQVKVFDHSLSNIPFIIRSKSEFDLYLLLRALDRGRPAHSVNSANLQLG